MSLKKFLGTKKGQNVLEYALVFGAVALAVATAFGILNGTNPVTDNGTIQGYFRNVTDANVLNITNLTPQG